MKTQKLGHMEPINLFCFLRFVQRILVCTGRLHAGSWRVWLRTSDYMLGQVYSTPAGTTMPLNALSYSLANLTEVQLWAYA